MWSLEYPNITVKLALKFKRDNFLWAKIRLSLVWITICFWIVYEARELQN